MEISDKLLCLFNADVRSEEDRYVVEVPKREVETGSLEPGETFRLVNSFEPQPLYSVLADRGFVHETDQVGPEEWHVYIRHES